MYHAVKVHVSRLTSNPKKLIQDHVFTPVDDTVFYCLPRFEVPRFKIPVYNDIILSKERKFKIKVFRTCSDWSRFKREGASGN